MRLVWLGFAAALAAAGCDKDGAAGAGREAATPVAREQPAAARPKPAHTSRRDPVDPNAPPPVVAMRVTGTGVVFGTKAGGNDARYIAPCEDGRFDTSALTGALRHLRSRPDLSRRSVIELAAAEGVPYQTVVAVMDAAIAAGFRDVGLVDPASQSVELPAHGGTELKTRCPLSEPAPAPTAARAETKPAPINPLLADVPVMVVSPAEVTLNGKRIARVSDVMAHVGDVVTAIRDPLKALPPAPADSELLPGTLILQADKTTDAKVINAVVKSAHAAGYSNIMFAVNARR